MNVKLFIFFKQIFDISWDPYQPNRVVSCGVKHIKVKQLFKRNLGTSYEDNLRCLCV